MSKLYFQLLMQIFVFFLQTNRINTVYNSSSTECYLVHVSQTLNRKRTIFSAACKIIHLVCVLLNLKPLRFFWKSRTKPSLGWLNIMDLNMQTNARLYDLTKTRLMHLYKIKRSQTISENNENHWNEEVKRWKKKDRKGRFCVILFK